MSETVIGVTWYLCPSGPDASSTHHLVPRRSGPAAGGASGFEQVCSYCEQSEGQLRQLGGTLAVDPATVSGGAIPVHGGGSTSP